MDISRVDLNLLVYLDVLLRERNVTKAANHLGITQPAMSNGLRRLRDLFGDPLLVRTSEGMTATERATELQPLVRGILSDIEQAVQEKTPFSAGDSQRVFRIMASDYAESCLMPRVLRRIRQEAPNVTLDVLTPSDVSFLDVEQGRLDMAINRFDKLPQSFHQKTLWTEYFACLMNAGNPIAGDAFTLASYLDASHIWVSKTGFGVGVGVNPKDVQRLGWVDEALALIGHKRQISVFTRHYQVAMLLAEQHDLIATLPCRAAWLQKDNPNLVVKSPPFEIPPFELKMAWSPLLQHNPDHQWLRRLIVEVAEEVDTEFAPFGRQFEGEIDSPG
ncbi:LysR family transcriptional regulator [Marinobacter zhejiangensis]|uniref:Transcriptional regulator, LysR family n=1 Tax=Marinobacter zhejiangensis TaxID=488535 RepID=A0A1I4RHT8_9GAMM|nr:LysR family transcriptional regulator [Marinobacter zhejiangensis]SFM51513.1 transcriptional regulator, LysR family [Marinobacter zhejiangensis]